MELMELISKLGWGSRGEIIIKKLNRSTIWSMKLISL